MSSAERVGEKLRALVSLWRVRQEAYLSDIQEKPNNPSVGELERWFGAFYAYKGCADELEASLSEQTTHEPETKQV